MTNEELALQAQSGDLDAIPKLWHQTRRFAASLALKWHRTFQNSGGVEMDDLMQCGYLAVSRAAETFHAGAGCSFLGWFKYHLLTEFCSACGMRTDRQKREPLRNAYSLDAPASGDSGCDLTLLETIEAPESGESCNRIEDAIYREQLREALESALKEIPEECAVVLRDRYYRCMTLRGTAEHIGRTEDEVRGMERRGMREMRKPKIAESLRPFVYFDLYRNSGVGSFARSGMSVQEQYMLRMEGLT